MSDFQKSVGGRDQHPEGWIGVNPIEKDKKGKEEYSEIKTRATKSLLFATVMIYLKKFLHLFSSRTKALSSSIDKQQILEDLFAFRKMLQILGNEDQSHNPEFTQQLSELWHTLIDDCHHIEEFGILDSAEIAPIRQFLEKIHSYPSGEDHSLGFYLTEYAGKEWLPFPFMDILHQLHQQNQENPETSQLAEWNQTLNELISTLDVKIDLNG